MADKTTAEVAELIRVAHRREAANFEVLAGALDVLELLEDSTQEAIFRGIKMQHTRARNARTAIWELLVLRYGEEKVAQKMEERQLRTQSDA